MESIAIPQIKALETIDDGGIWRFKIGDVG